MTRKRILFFGEPATLAHVVRPLLLAQSLSRDKYDVGFATGGEYRALVERAGLAFWVLRNIGTAAYLEAVAAGRPVFPISVLTEYASDDLAHIERFRPDVVVGDFRLSLAVSARVAGIPYIGISNAYWSPLARHSYRIPVLPMTRVLGVQLSNAVFSFFRPLIFAYHSMPMNMLRKRYGMKAIGWDLCRIFTEADKTLFSDVPEMVPTESCVESNRYDYIGPIVWSPEGDLPAKLNECNGKQPIVYVTLGSSGDSRVVKTIVAAALQLGCLVVLSGVGVSGALSGDEIIAAEFLPGSKVAAISSVVVCNGGSPTTHQALQVGTPVLGIPSNLDQLLNMQYVVDAGAGLMLRADCVSENNVGRCLQRIIGEGGFKLAAVRISNWFTKYQATERFGAIISRIPD